MNGDHSTAHNESTRVERAAGFVRRRRTAVVVYLKGFAMGAAATVPGVSGGTIALIAGIYDRFILALTNLDTELLKRVSGVHRQSGRTQFRQAASERDLVFLGLLFIGILTAIFTLARVFNALLETYPGPTFAFFGGLIGASAVVLYDRRWLSVRIHFIAAAVGFTLAFFVTGATTIGVFPETIWMVFIAAAISISGMVLPGLSGSFILLILGQYTYITGVVTSFGDNLLAVPSEQATMGLLSDGAVLGTYAMGAVVGFLTTAHVIRTALQRYPGATFAFLVSLMVGALRLPVVEVANTTDPSPVPVAVVLGAALAGAALVLVLERSTESVGYDAYT